MTTHRGHDETKWTYRFEPEGGGTRVTESFEILSDLPWYLRLTQRVLMGVKDRRADLESGMSETLRRLEAAAEADLSATHRRYLVCESGSPAALAMCLSEAVPYGRADTETHAVVDVDELLAAAQSMTGF